jgi:TfoX/Sxy family transcriptional regulator of competence genes
MAYDEGLAERVREQVTGRKGVTEKHMFGGVCWLLDGKMFVGIAKQSLMARIGPDAYDTALAKKHVRVMDFTGKPMKGYVFVDPGGLDSDRELAGWIDGCMKFVATIKKK